MQNIAGSCQYIFCVFIQSIFADLLKDSNKEILFHIQYIFYSYGTRGTFNSIIQCTSRLNEHNDRP